MNGGRVTGQGYDPPPPPPLPNERPLPGQLGIDAMTAIAREIVADPNRVDGETLAYSGREIALARVVVEQADALDRIAALAQAEGESEIAHRVYVEASRG